MHDVCLREIASQATASRQLRTASDHVTDSTTTISFYLSGYFTPPALRHKSYTEPDRHSVLFCSVSFRHARPESTRPTLPSASLYRTVLFCAARSIPFRLARVPTDSRQSVPFYSALFHSGPYCPTLLPTHTAPKPIDLVHLLQPKTHTQHISPSATRDNQLSSLLMRWETFPNRISHSSQYSNINLSYTTAQQPAIVPLHPSAARLLHALSVEIQKIPSHYTAAIRSLCAEPHIKTGW